MDAHFSQDDRLGFGAGGVRPAGIDVALEFTTDDMTLGCFLFAGFSFSACASELSFH